MKKISLSLLLIASLGMVSCETFTAKNDVPQHERGTVSATTLSKTAMARLPKELSDKSRKKKQPSHEQFVKDPTYIAGNELWQNPSRLSVKSPKRLEIHTRTQRGMLYVGDQVAMDFPLTTGRARADKRTPKGTFSVTEKVVNKRSTLYGSFVNSKNQIVRGGVRVTDRRPSGSRFRGAPLPYWMRFNGAVGLHQGNVHRYPASNGCVRVPKEVAPLLYQHMAKGARVTVL